MRRSALWPLRRQLCQLRETRGAQRNTRSDYFFGLPVPAPVTRGGNPVCCVSSRPFTGAAAFTGLPAPGVEFFRRALT